VCVCVCVCVHILLSPLLVSLPRGSLHPNLVVPFSSSCRFSSPAIPDVFIEGNWAVAICRSLDNHGSDQDVDGYAEVGEESVLDDAISEERSFDEQETEEQLP
jgi:hypothetical protein